MINGEQSVTMDFMLLMHKLRVTLSVSKLDHSGDRIQNSILQFLSGLKTLLAAQVLLIFWNARIMAGEIMTVAM